MMDGDEKVIEETERPQRSALATECVESPCITISDVITKLNSTIRAQIDATAHTADISKMKGFELHARLPDGSARPATDSEIATADFQSKLQQAVTTLQSLPDDASKFKWVEHQRVNVGNVYFENQEYENAIDVYLTCLTVATPSPTPGSDTGYSMEYLILYMKIMNNLALSTMNLKWYGKTITFCTMAIDQILITLPTMEIVQQATNSTSDDIAKIILEQQMKLYYKRAKAYRLKGEYDLARGDIIHIKRELNPSLTDRMTKTTNDAPNAIELMRNTVSKEEQLLKHAIQEGNKNLKHRQMAMKQLLEHNTNVQCTSTDVVHQSRSRDSNNSKTIQPLYYDQYNVNPQLQRRDFSTLRSRKSYSNNERNLIATSKSSTTTFHRQFQFRDYVAPVYCALMHLLRWVCHVIIEMWVRCFRSRTHKPVAYPP